MSTYITDGAYDELTIADGLKAPWYIITFDAEGGCTSPQARASLLAAVRYGGFEHVIVFSHGWNNVWSDVEGLNRNLIKALAEVWQPQDWAHTPRLLVVSIFWPSVAVLAEAERGPVIAAAGDEDADQLALETLAEALPEAAAQRLRELARHGELSPDEATEFAALLLPLIEGADETEAPPPSSDQLITLARTLAEPEAEPDGVITDPDSDVWGDIGGGPDAAGTLSPLSWRFPIRMGSVYAMKRRAGIVGAHGVAPLLHDLLAASTSAIHLAGHSYGCRVMLSAVCAQPFDDHKPESLLLLQPAVSRYCFAEQVPTTGRPGGYRAAMEQVHQPIMSTFSEHDAALHKLFGVAMALAKDIGEPEIAGPFDSIYAALGGYGPAGVAFAQTTVKLPGEAYPQPVGKRILVLDGSLRLANDPQPAIRDHGDVTNRYTGWMLYCQLLA
jgi:hypothetical protein